MAHSDNQARLAVLAHGYHDGGSIGAGSLVHTFVHSIVAGIGRCLGYWIFHALGFGTVAVVAVIAVIWWLRSRGRASGRFGR